MTAPLRTIMMGWALGCACLVTAPASSQVGAPGASVQAPTAESQSNEPADLETTRRIREALVASDDLSLRAKNLMVVTTPGGQVTLRGQVEAPQERAIAVSIAERIAGEGRVRDLISVAPD